ncbi:hypothetical protein ACFQ6Q_34970 [Streptomyces sp. NPDC056437]|uniref:hypothetical protein n=1 Tax=Streptomyces sp. NPDC056437 TaxID=3345816 RepID=UPI0036B0C691
MAEDAFRDRVRELKSMLEDCVTDDEPGDPRVYQSTALSSLAELLATYEKRIAELEEQVKRAKPPMRA